MKDCSKRLLFLGILVCALVLSACQFQQLLTTTEPSGEASADASADVVEASVDRISNDKYAYNAISSEAQAAYDEILYTILQFDESIDLSTCDMDVMETAYEAVNSDYGGLFWVSGYSYYKYTDSDGNIIRLSFEPNYTMTQSEAEEYQTQVDAVVTEYLSDISPSDSDYTKVKTIFDKLIENVDYVSDSQDNQNILSVFLYGETVCQGYANAMQYLLTQLDIPCIVVTGEANGTAHAWNIALLDGDYYCIDVTWGNSSYSTDTDVLDFVNYAYFCVTTSELSATHTANMRFDIPQCAATADNYFVQEGLYFESLDADAIGAVLQEAYEAGEPCMVKFASSEIYESALSYFVTEQNITYYCKGLTQVVYLEDAEHNILVFEF